MPDITQDDLRNVSAAFRAKFQTLSAQDKTDFITVLQSAFQIADRRNATLWVTNATTRRNFCNRSVSPLELEARYAFALAFVQTIEPSFPIKTREFRDTPIIQGKKLRRYLFEDYTQDALHTASYAGGILRYIYAVDSTDVDYIPETLSDEFASFFS